MGVTVKDVAKYAGVSPSTVSRVCNNTPAISAETQDKVRRAMAELGYVLPTAALPLGRSCCLDADKLTITIGGYQT